MIIRESRTDLLLITQPDHAALAARIAREWTADDFLRSRSRPAILFAIAEHDNGWREPDGSPIVDPSTGRLLDFVSAPVDVRRGVWPRGVERLAAAPYAAALVAQHAVHIYGRFREDAAWQPYFDDMLRRRTYHLERAGESVEQLLADYSFVRIADLMSLAFCNAWTDGHPHGPYTVSSDGDRLRVTPDPFDGRAIPLEIRARRLPHRPFVSVDDARRAFEEAPQVTLTGIAAGA